LEKGLKHHFSRPTVRATFSSVGFLDEFVTCALEFLAMNRPHVGQANLGALAGAVIGAIGGLFGIGIAPAVAGKDPALLFQTPILGFFCFLVGGTFGWLIGGQIGPRLAGKLGRPIVELIGGAFGGIVPVALIAWWGWYMIKPH